MSTPVSPAAWFTTSAYARPPALTTCASRRWNPAPFDATESSRAVCEKMSGLGVRRVPFGDSIVAKVPCWDGARGMTPDGFQGCCMSIWSLLRTDESLTP